MPGNSRQVASSPRGLLDQLNLGRFWLVSVLQLLHQLENVAGFSTDNHLHPVVLGVPVVAAALDEEHVVAVESGCVLHCDLLIASICDVGELGYNQSWINDALRRLVGATGCSFLSLVGVLCLLVNDVVDTVHHIEVPLAVFHLSALVHDPLEEGALAAATVGEEVAQVVLCTPLAADVGVERILPPDFGALIAARRACGLNRPQGKREGDRLEVVDAGVLHLVAEALPDETRAHFATVAGLAAVNVLVLEASAAWERAALCSAVFQCQLGCSRVLNGDVRPVSAPFPGPLLSRFEHVGAVGEGHLRALECRGRRPGRLRGQLREDAVGRRLVGRCVASRRRRVGPARRRRRRVGRHVVVGGRAVVGRRRGGAFDQLGGTIWFSHRVQAVGRGLDGHLRSLLGQHREQAPPLLWRRPRPASPVECQRRAPSGGGRQSRKPHQAPAAANMRCQKFSTAEDTARRLRSRWSGRVVLGPLRSQVLIAV
mmetsp:Transcript_109309/g.296458  ORF Transcript_109309/g.296458 Transcript_109309/m.296458 type:complete len:485 (-) Transcript_109309:72-1526(-)